MSASGPDLDNDPKPPAGNVAAATMPMRQIPSGKPDGTTIYVRAAGIPVAANRRITSVTLPRTPAGGQMHVFAIGGDAR